MRKPRVYVPRLAREIKLSGREARHLAQVLRVRPGREVIVFDGSGMEATARVAEVTTSTVTLSADPPQRAEREPPFELVLFVALLKGDKLATVVRAASELGVSRFVPLVSERSVPRSIGESKLKRLRRIAIEAAKQSGRALAPTVSAPLAFEKLTAVSFGLVAHPYAGSRLAAVSWPRSGAVALASGPEGGFSEDEVERLSELGFAPVRLGPRILRAETAPIVLAAAAAALRDI